MEAGEPMAPERLPHRRYRCCYCGQLLPVWLPAAQAVDGAMLLDHLGQQHPDQVGAYLDQMPTDDDHDRVVVQAYDVVEDPPSDPAHPEQT
jgi:hypothetical protein